MTRRDPRRAGRDLPGGLLAVSVSVLAVAVTPSQMLLVAMSLFVGALTLRSRTSLATTQTRTDAVRA